VVIPLIFLIIFYFYPIWEIASVTVRRLEPGWMQNIPWGVISNAAGFTVFQAVLSTLLTLLLGLPAAYLFGTYRFKGKNLLKILTTIPFILPTVVVAAGFNAIIGPRGWLNLLLMRLFSLSQPVINLQNSLAAILIAHIFYNTSIVIRVVGGALEQMDPKLEMASRMLGASSWKTFKNITLLLLVPSIVSALMLVFLFDFTSFGVILMLGGPGFSTLEVEIYIQTIQFLNLPLAGILSFMQLFFSMAISFLVMRSGGEFIAPIVPHVKSERLKSPEKPGEKLFLAITVAVLIVLLVFPLVGLVLRSFLSVETTRAGQVTSWNLTFNFYRSLFENTRASFFYVPPIKALWNSLLFASASSVLAILLGFMLSAGIQGLARYERLIELLVLLPLGTSAVTLGLGFFTAFSGTTASLRYYPLLIPAAHTLIALPFVMRVIQPAMESIPESLKGAAKMLGASPFDVWRYIELPLILRAVITSLIYSFTISLGEFGATSFLARPELPTLPIAIFRYLNLPGGNNYGQAMAMAVIILVVCALSIFWLERLQSGKAENDRMNERA